MFRKSILMLAAASTLALVPTAFAAAEAPTASSPDGQHTAAVIIHENGTKSVLLDGKDIGMFDVNGDSYFQFDSDNHLIFVANQ